MENEKPELLREEKPCALCGGKFVIYYLRKEMRLIEGGVGYVECYILADESRFPVSGVSKYCPKDLDNINQTGILSAYL